MSDSPDIESIAIVGLSGRFPGASSVNEFWTNICGGQECISFFSDEELLANGADPDLMGDTAYVRARGVLSSAELFDEAFFGFTTREAEITDPQHRIFLECTWEAMEDAGYVPETIKGSVGVFAGSSLNTYLLHHVFANPVAAEDFIRGFQADGYPVLIGNDKDYLATRVAHKLDLRGPAITIQTACSTSLVAVVQACQSLLAYQCDAALAGGVSITFPQQRGYIYQDGAIASADGHCRAFDAGATGTVFGSGCGVVLLKRLSDAIDDGDTIYSVIKGAAVNNDGSEKVSFSAPGVDGQAEVVALAHALAGISADTIGYVEAHGTGTPLGDPIEVAALTQAFKTTTNRKQFCGLGSVKTNVGHLEAAAGVTGLIKASLAIDRRCIPPSLHFEKPNPDIDFESSPFYMVTQLMEWPKTMHPRRAGVSSFGMGGTNAHIVLEEAPVRVERPSISVPQIIPVSARDEDSLASACVGLGHFLQEESSSSSTFRKTDLTDIAYTLQVGRRAFPYRHAVIAKDSTEVSDLLSGFSMENEIILPCPGAQRPVAFLFPGQGVQRVNMCRGLYENESYFKGIVDGCCDELLPTIDFDLRHILYPSPVEELKAEKQLNSTALVQPALFVLGYSLAKLLINWGIHPSMLLGHSIGEFVAAVLAEIMSLEDALRLVASRGRLMQEMPKGAMLAARLSESEILPYLKNDLFVAAANAPKNTVVSGPVDSIEKLKLTLSTEGIGFRELQTSHAFHSDMMKIAAEKFLEEVRQVSLGKAKLKIISTKTGQWIEPSEWAEPEYWSRQMLEPVRFMDAAMSLLEDSSLIIFNIGPGQTLANLIRQNPAQRPGHLVVSGAPHAKKDGGHAAMLKAIGKLWCAGVEIDWHAIHGDGHRFRVPLPTYPFNRKRFRIEPETDAGKRSATQTSEAELSDMETDVSSNVRNHPISEKTLEQIILEQLQIMAGQLDSIKHGRHKH